MNNTTTTTTTTNNNNNNTNNKNTNNALRSQSKIHHARHAPQSMFPLVVLLTMRMTLLLVMVVSVNFRQFDLACLS